MWPIAGINAKSVPHERLDEFIAAIRSVWRISNFLIALMELMGLGVNETVKFLIDRNIYYARNLLKMGIDVNCALRVTGFELRVTICGLIRLLPRNPQHLQRNA